MTERAHVRSLEEDRDGLLLRIEDLEADVSELLRGRELMLELLELYRENRELRQRLDET